jgi:hypothetical protein
MPFVYERPLVDQAPPWYQVQAQHDVAHVKGVEEAVQLYLAAFWQQFIDKKGAARRTKWLYRFVVYLEAHDHSLHLIGLTYEELVRLQPLFQPQE